MNNFYKRYGYKKIKFYNKNNLLLIKKKILYIFKTISLKKKSNIKIKNHRDIIKLFKKNKRFG